MPHQPPSFLSLIQICHINRFEFERNANGNGFFYHTHFEHNVYAYVFLFVHLRKTPPDQYTGIETYVARRVLEGDISFFPVGAALSLQPKQGPAAGASAI